MAMNKKQTIQLTEQDLHMLVEDAVRTYLVNEGMDEISWSGLRGVGSAFKQNMQNMGKNIRNTYNASKQNNQIFKLATNAKNALEALKDAAQQFNPQLANLCKVAEIQIDQATAGSQNNLETMRQRTFSTQNYGQQ